MVSSARIVVGFPGFRTLVRHRGPGLAALAAGHGRHFGVCGVVAASQKSVRTAFGLEGGGLQDDYANPQIKPRKSFALGGPCCGVRGKRGWCLCELGPLF